jgi:TerC family integral membrane protein
MSENPIVKFAKKYFRTTDKFDGANFFTVVDGVKYATPLLLCLVCIELSDIVFAFDSVPAVFGVTQDPFIVYTSNIFAIAGLRSLFVVLSTAISKLEYLEKAVGIVLGVIAAKLTGETFGVEILTPLQSLLVVLTILGGGVGYSLYKAKEEEES